MPAPHEYGSLFPIGSSEDPVPPLRPSVDPSTLEPLEYEQHFWDRGVTLVAGVDEVGRGPLAGPVVAACVILSPGRLIEGADDSKALSTAVREELYPRIRDGALAVGVGAASVREIDRLNILQASTLAMKRALRATSIDPDHVVVDGLPVKGFEVEHEAVVGGDAVIHSIACASIVAKVVRDRLMLRLSSRWPRYGWETNMGYGTSAHRDAIEAHGVTPHHRRSFCGFQYGLDL